MRGYEPRPREPLPLASIGRHRLTSLGRAGWIGLYSLSRLLSRIVAAERTMGIEFPGLFFMALERPAAFRTGGFDKNSDESSWHGDVTLAAVAIVKGSMSRSFQARHFGVEFETQLRGFFFRQPTGHLRKDASIDQEFVRARTSSGSGR